MKKFYDALPKTVLRIYFGNSNGKEWVAFLKKKTFQWKLKLILWFKMTIKEINFLLTISGIRLFLILLIFICILL